MILYVAIVGPEDSVVILLRRGDNFLALLGLRDSVCVYTGSLKYFGKLI